MMSKKKYTDFSKATVFSLWEGSCQWKYEAHAAYKAERASYISFSPTRPLLRALEA